MVSIVPARTIAVFSEPADPLPAGEPLEGVPHKIFLDVSLNLGFGVEIRRCLWIEGIQDIIQPAALDEAVHCAIVLLGGKKLLVQADTGSLENPILSRVYLNRQIYGDPPGMTRLAGVVEKMLEVGTFWKTISARGYRVEDVTRILNKPVYQRSDAVSQKR